MRGVVENHARSTRGLRVLIIDKVSPRLIEMLRAHGMEVTYKPGMGIDELIEEIGGYHILVLRGRLKITRKLLERAPRLRVIARAGIGLDNIDLDAAAELGVRVVNTPEASAQSVAELTIMLMLAAARRLKEALAITSRGQWKKITGIELYGKKLSIIGYGRIGSRVASIAGAIGLNVTVYDICDKAVSSARSNGIRVVEDLYEALRTADIISLHVPLTSATRHMISYDEFKAMKNNVIFINTSRGGVVDTRALLWALDTGIIGAAGLDVLENEPPGPLEERLISHPRVIVTPHIGAQTIEAQDRIADVLVKKILEVLGH